MKGDTGFGSLVNKELKQVYGNDFQWEKVTIVRDGNGGYVVEIDVSKQALLEEVK